MSKCAEKVGQSLAKENLKVQAGPIHVRVKLDDRAENGRRTIAAPLIQLLTYYQGCILDSRGLQVIRGISVRTQP